MEEENSIALLYSHPGVQHMTAEDIERIQSIQELLRSCAESFLASSLTVCLVTQAQKYWLSLVPCVEVDGLASIVERHLSRLTATKRKLDPIRAAISESPLGNMQLHLHLKPTKSTAPSLQRMVLGFKCHPASSVSLGGQELISAS